MVNDKKHLSAFLKFAYEHNGVRDVKEAFYKFPPEEEWYGGKIDYFIKDDKDEEK